MNWLIFPVNSSSTFNGSPLFGVKDNHHSISQYIILTKNISHAVNHASFIYAISCAERTFFL